MTFVPPPDPYSMGHANRKPGESLWSSLMKLNDRISALENVPPGAPVDLAPLEGRITTLENKPAPVIPEAYVDPYVPCTNAVTCKARVLPADMVAHVAWHGKLNSNNALIKVLLPLLGYQQV